MQKSEMAQVLTFAHSIQGGETTDLEVRAWHEIVGHLDYDDVMRTAQTHFRTQSRKLWPADVLKAQIPKNERWMYA